MKTIFVFLSLSIVLVGCATNFEILSSYDEFTGTRTYQMNNNIIQGANTSLISSNRIELNAVKKITKGGDFKYFLQLYLSASDWYFVQEGNSLILLIDGKTFELSVTKENMHTKVLSGGVVNRSASIVEDLYYNTDIETIKALANGKDIKIKIIGRDGYFVKEIKEENINNFKTFLDNTEKISLK